MKKILLLALLCCTAGFTQEKTPTLNFKTEKDSAYYADYEKLKTLIKAEKSTLEYKHFENLMAAYKSKWRAGYDGDAKELVRNGALGWIKSNIHKTKFSTYEEAEKDYNAAMAALITSTTTPEGKAHSQFSNKAVMTYGPQMIIDVTLEEMGLENTQVKLPPVKSPVKDAAYKEKYEKLKTLAINYINLPSVAKARKATNEYNAKWVDIRKGTESELIEDPGGLKWLEKNWEKTSFKSYEAARKEYETVANYAMAVLNDPLVFEYKEYQSEVMHLYGTEIITELAKDMKKNYPDKYY